ncbi:TPA: restriction endonuclease subunit S [Streptococcus suis]|nr:restriction endonuclease subunit S [Streptococcus suis]
MSEVEFISLVDSGIEILDGDRGKNYPAKSDLAKHGDCVFLNTGNVKNNGFDFSDVDFISFEKDFSLRNGKLLREDIVMTTRGTVGNLAYYSKDIRFNHIRINSGMVIIRVNQENWIPYFIYLFLQSDLFKKQTQKLISGSAQPQLPISVLETIRIPNYSMKQQEFIANQIQAIDQKIALNNQINEELEAMAKTLYDYWFVQFDFPDENGKPYKSSGGKMAYNDQLKREIPEGWGVKQLGELCEFRNGINYEKSEAGDTLSKIVNVRNISNSSTFVTTYDLDSITLDRRRIENYLVTDRTILITRSGIPGATRLVSDIPANTIYSGFIIGATVANLNLFYYVFYHLKNIEMLMSNQSAGTIMKNISQTTLSEIRIAIPNKEIQKVFSNQVRSLLDVIENNLKQNQELTQLRDWLLPMLMNGQVKVE